MRVKGSAIIDLVKTIRSQPNRKWDKYLTPADREIVNRLILPGSYYPGDTFWRISWAVTAEIGRGNLDESFEFGRGSALTHLQVYKRLTVMGDIERTIKNFVDLWETFYDHEGAPHERMRVEVKPNEVRVTAHDFPDMMAIPENRSSYFHGLAGFFQGIAEAAVPGKRIHNTIHDDGTRFVLTYRW